MTPEEMFPRTFAALHDAKRAGGLTDIAAALSEEMERDLTPMEIVAVLGTAMSYALRTAPEPLKYAALATHLQMIAGLLPMAPVSR